GDGLRLLPPAFPALPPHPVVLLRRFGLPGLPRQAPDAAALPLAGRRSLAGRDRAPPLLPAPTSVPVSLPRGALRRPAPLAAAFLVGGRSVALPHRTGHRFLGAGLGPPLRRDHP